MPAEETNDISTFEDALTDPGEACYIFRLYVSGSTPRSLRAVQNLRDMCEAHLQGRYQFEVVDIYQQPKEAARDQIIAAPTLIKELPFPVKRLIGDLSDRDKVLVGLNLAEETPEGKKAAKTRWASL